MTRRKLSALISSLLCSLCGIAQTTPAYLIEAESFQFKGKWVVEKSSECLGTAMLRVYQDNNDADTADALTVININEAGTYSIWTRSRDYTDSPRPRTFTLSVDGRELPECGNHGTDGFLWQKIGEIELPRKQILLRLHDSGKYYGRCDAILLTQDSSTDPNLLTNQQLARWRKSPVEMAYSTQNAPELPAARDLSDGYSTIASASNSDIRLSFVKLPDGAIVCKTDFYTAGSWRRFSSTNEDNRIALLSNDENVTVNHNQFYPAWDRCAAHRQFDFDGQTYPVTVDGDNANPFYTGILTEAKAKSVSKPAANIIKVVYDCTGKGELTAWWTVAESGPRINVRLVFRPVSDGSYSIALHAAKGIGEESVKNVLMPPMFQSRNIPATPLMLFSSMMTQCLSVAEIQTSYGPVTNFICADLDSFSQGWGSADYSPVGFTLRNSSNEIQPVGFAPLPGMKDASVKAGSAIETNFIVGIHAADWAGTLEYISENIFSVSDYRRQETISLTQTLENVIALIKNPDHSGWNDAMKGFWDIEANGSISPTVVQSSPMTVVGTAMLTDDEELYEKRALPSIEYVLSRNNFRYVGNVPQKFAPMSSQFPTTLYEGINTVMAGLNPWLKEIALPDGQLRTANGYFTKVQPFRQALSAYILTSNEEWLDRSTAFADSYIAEISQPAESAPAAPGTFYNSQICYDWQPLVDLYHHTGKQPYIKAALQGAAHTLAGVKTWPKVASGCQTVHPGNSYDGITTVWWKGAAPYRLGFPRTAGDAPEHETDAWKVSSVGLGIEQPLTYFIRSAGKTVHPIFMNSWAPRLLELTEATSKPIYETFARNAVIGRSENYPGYYATGYTDINQSADFPYKGPDVSSIYYHHLPAYLALLQDYLITEATSRSNGKIFFPSGRQEGFVWFSNSVYGRATGEIYGNEAYLWMPAGNIKADSPAVNILSARNSRKLFIVLTNENNEECHTAITLSDDVLRRISSTAATVYNIDGKESELDLGEKGLTVTVPSRSLMTIAIEMAWENGQPIPALADGFSVTDSSTQAGNIYLYRIRSPFGWDSIYGFADSTTTDGLAIKVECNGQDHTVSTWPYEWSFAKFGYDEDVEIKVTIIRDGKTVRTIENYFNSEKVGLETIETDSRQSGTSGIYRLDGMKIPAITQPGVYIVDGQKILHK